MGPIGSIAVRRRGLDPAQLTTAEPQWTSLAARTLAKPGPELAWNSKRPLRVEAAACHGRPVFFRSAMGPWTAPDRVHSDSRTPREKAAGIIETGLGILLMFCASWLAVPQSQKEAEATGRGMEDRGRGVGYRGPRLGFPGASATHHGHAGAILHGA